MKLEFLDKLAQFWDLQVSTYVHVCVKSRAKVGGEKVRKERGNEGGRRASGRIHSGLMNSSLPMFDNLENT